MERRLALVLGLLVVSASSEDPNAAADGIYSECVLSLNYPCLQRKALVFIDRLGRSEKFPLVGDGIISLVRTSPPAEEIKEESLRSLDGDTLGDMVDTSVVDFFQTHVFRLDLPDWLKTPGSRSDNALDFYVGDNEVEEGRKKGGGGGGGGKKGMKKMMMSMCMMMAGKFMMLAPLLLGLTKLAAIKALVMAFVSLTISKIIILKKLKSQKGGGGWSSGGGGGGWSSGGGGGGWSSGGGGGGGWDRSFSSHELAYKSHLQDNSA
ncbi:uncharacterized protein LOC106666931 [Cimex lectularius]|uniref:Osiris n=1 Tax=Cimex lectularius TaxID=79782 RepID=A0A8I6RXV3_CIMLE|nr:uncharacterized protein LOC106666931 [Cimex lectularius]